METPFFAPVRAHGRQIIGLGILGYVLLQVFFILGVSLTTAGTAALLAASIPIWTAAVSRLLNIDRLGRLAWIGLAVAFSGTIVVIVPDASSLSLVGSAMLGNVAILVYAFLTGVHTTLNRPALDHVSPTALTFFGLLGSLPLLYGLALPYVDWTAIQHVSPEVLGAVLYSGSLSIGIAPIWWAVAIKELGLSTTGVYGNFTPIVGLATGAVFLGEVVTMVHLLGAALLLGGVLIVRVDQLQRGVDSQPIVQPLHADCPPGHLCRVSNEANTQSNTG